MTGWRIGYAAAPKFLAKACDIIQGQYTSGASSISQIAAIQAMQISRESSDEVQNMLRAFKERRDLVYELLSDIPDIKVNMPDGAFYFFPEVNSYYGKLNGGTTIENSKDLCYYLLDKAYVALVPGSAFGNPDCVRISYATSKELLIEAIKRIKVALAELK